MIAKLIAVVALPLAAAACVGSEREEALASSARIGPDGPSEAQEAAARANAKEVGRSLWAVLAEAPDRKQEVRPDMIRGSAVAVGPDRLLASCGALARRDRVGLLRHNKYRIAQAEPVDAGGEVCALTIRDTELNVASTFRGPDDLRLGERVYALTNRTGAELTLAEGALRSATAATAALKTSIMLPAGTRSAVLFDAEGNLIGLASGMAPDRNGSIATALTADTAPQLANRDLGESRRGLSAFLGTSDAVGPSGGGFLDFLTEPDAQMDPGPAV